MVAKDQWPPRQLTRNDWAWDKHPSWSPDGQQIVFESNRDGQHRLWLMNADGSNQRPLTDPILAAHAPVSAPPVMPEKVLLLTISSCQLTMPPPVPAQLPEKALLLTVKVP